MWYAIFLIVLGTTIWLTYDSQINKIPIDKKEYSLNNGALAWFFSSILLWIVTFPYYLVKRSQVLQLRQNTISSQETVKSRSINVEEELRRLKRLLDDKIITQDEFNKKKSKILGL